MERRTEKRNRPPLSCEPCRARKLKCNRSLPCDTCTRRNIDQECKYAANANRKPRAPATQMKDLKERLSSLENVLSSLVSQDGPSLNMNASPDQFLMAGLDQQQQFPAVTSDPVGPESGSDILGSASSQPELTPNSSTASSHVQHVGSSGGPQVDYLDRGHWLSILDDIKEVRECLQETIQPVAQPGVHPDHGHEPFFAIGGDTKVEDILASLPSRSTCDLLVAWFFNCRFMFFGIVHPAKFQREYTSFFASPFSTSPLWIALLFSILCVSTIARRISNIPEPPGSVPSVSTLQACTTACLEAGRYRSASAPHALEAFLLHLQSCFFTRGVTPQDDLWFEMGTIIRLAVRTGHHRDPDGISGVTPFEGEMRRRVWLNIVQIDALMAFQFGLPSMIPSTDTRVPGNLHYTDLEEGMKRLPPSRPLDEYTPMTYTVVKADVMRVFKKIAEQTQSPLEEGRESLEAEMRLAYSQVPGLLQRRDVNQSLFTDEAHLIWERCTIELLYLKGLVLLYRHHVSYHGGVRSREEERGSLVCVDAALEILHRQADMDEACGPGGRLRDDAWMFMFLPLCDFLTAAMVVCLDLSVLLQRQQQEGGNTERIDREYHSLGRTLQIWERKEESSAEAHVAATTLRLMLRRAAEKRDGMDAAVVQEGGLDLEWPYAESMGQMIDGSEEIDWALLDQYFQNLVP